MAHKKKRGEPAQRSPNRNIQVVYVAEVTTDQEPEPFRYGSFASPEAALRITRERVGDIKRIRIIRTFEKV
jgi:hypothetical protein